MVSQLTANALTDLVSDSLPKFGQTALALLGFFGVLVIIFFVAARATGRLQAPLALMIFLGPAFLLVLIGLVLPAIRTLYLSFYGAATKSFVGIDNYSWAFTNEDSRQVLLNTAIWIVVAPIGATAVGLLLALLTDRMKHEAVPKSIIFMPMAISFVGASIIWNLVYNYRDPNQTPAPSQVGLLTQLALWVGWKNPPNWLLSQPLNTFLLIIVMIWIQTGFALVVLSAAIKAIPGDVIEAASIDGASGFKLFRTITIPMIRGTLVVVLTTIAIGTLKVFDIVRTMTGGNYGTEVLANSMYRQTFDISNVGRGAALAVILFIAVVPLVTYNIMQLRKERAS